MKKKATKTMRARKGFREEFEHAMKKIDDALGKSPS